MNRSVSIGPVLVLFIMTLLVPSSSQAQSDADYLGHALEAERFIDSMRTDGEEGALWRQSVEANTDPRHSFYYGSGGIAVFYLELYAATSKERFLKTAVSAGNEVLAARAKEPNGIIGMGSGLAGDVFVLTELYKHTQDERFAEGARRCVLYPGVDS